MKVQRHFASNDWTLQDSKCAGQHALVHCGADGEHVCVDCFKRCSDQRFLTRLSTFVLDLDAARLLHCRMFATEKVDDLIASLKQKAVYTQRSKTVYDHMLDLSTPALHKQASRNVSVQSSLETYPFNPLHIFSYLFKAKPYLDLFTSFHFCSSKNIKKSKFSCLGIPCLSMK